MIYKRMIKRPEATKKQLEKKKLLSLKPYMKGGNLNPQQLLKLSKEDIMKLKNSKSHVQSIYE
jgi:hypothetical protein